MQDINNILMTPLKIPKLQPENWDKFWEVWKRDSRQYVRQLPDSRGHNEKFPGWNGFIWEFGYEPFQQMYDVHMADYSKEFPEMRATLDNLPFRVKRILFLSSTKSIPLHRDGMYLTDHLSYPCAVRYMLYDDNNTPNFFFASAKDREKKYLTLPNETNGFVYNNPKIMHGSDYLDKFKIIAHLVIDNIVEDEWFKILKSSIVEYKDYCISE